MRVTADIIKDSFYKMYFYLPDVGEYNLSYKYCVKDFWNLHGVSGVEASIAYIRTETKEFLEEYREEVTDYSVNVKRLPANIEVDITDDQMNEAIFAYIQEKQAELNQGYKYDRVNEYWKLHSQELLFLIRRRNNFENAAMKKEVQKNLSEFNDNALRFINELIQNADDCIYKDDFNAFTMLFDRETNEIKISYPEAGFTYADVISLSSINETNKMSNFVKATSTIGEKGRGFKSIFVYFKEVEILSGGFHFKYNVEEASMFQPLYIEGGENQLGTQLTLKLRDKIILSSEEDEEPVPINSDIEKLIQDVEYFYGAKNAEGLYRNNSIFFTRHFTELRIVFQGRLYSDLICIKNNHCITDADSQDTIWWHNPNGKNTHICKGDMSYLSACQVRNDEVEEYFDLEILDKAYQINLIGLINYLEYPANIAENRFGKIRNTDVLNNLSKTMPIIMFGISGIDFQKELEIENASNFTGHMYTYLPTSVNLHLPFIFQVPFDLENNRSCPKKGSWNNYLYDAIWGSKDSIVKNWYEYIAKHNLVANIYNYLPTKKYDKIAFYIDEKYNFDPMGGSRYAAIAKSSIEQFNNSNRNRIRNLFSNIRIFKCWNSNKVVSISKLKIVDPALAMFDIEEENLLWNAYVDTNSESVRFEQDLSHEDSLKVVSFNRFLGNKDLSVKIKEIFNSEGMHKHIENSIVGLAKNKHLDYVHRFTSVYIQKRLWESVFNIDFVDNLKETEKQNIRSWGSNLLWFKLKTVEGNIRSFKYKDNELDKTLLWLYNISNEEIPSLKYEQDIYVCILGKSDLDDKTVKTILFKESQHVENLEEVYNSIDNWKNKIVTLENKIDIIGIYYLLQKGYPEVITGTLHRVLSEVEDLSQIKLPSVPEKTIERQIEWERVKFCVWIACKKKKPYELDLDLLSEEIISLLNPVEGEFISCNDKNTKFRNSVRGYLLKDEDKENCTNAFKKKYLNIYVNQGYFDRLPGRNILKFPANHTLILRELAALSEALESETKLSIDFIKEVRHIYEAIKSNTYTAPYGMKYELAVIKGIQAYQIYSLIDANNYREAIGNEGIVFNELLQNINDYIDVGTSVIVQMTGSSDRRGVRIVYKEKSHQEQRFGKSEDRSGFQAKDILSLISIGVSSKKGKSDQYTGSKGIGFKNVYRMFDLIEVDSNGFRFALDDSYLVDAEKLFDDVSLHGIKSIQSDKKLKVEEILESYREEENTENILKGISERTKFPIIQVSKNPIEKEGYFILNNDILGNSDLNEDSLTAFQFRFRNDAELYRSFISQLRSNYYVDRILQNLSEEKIQGHTFRKLSMQGYNYRILFLHNCKSIRVESDGHIIEKYDVPKITNDIIGELDESWVEDGIFWSNRLYLEDLNLLPDKSPRYMRKKNTEEDGILKNIEVRFMKIPVILDDNGQKVLNSNGLLYVTLPLDINVGGAVHINIPALETQANREKLIYCDMNNYSISGKWNKDILEKVFGPQGVFIELFNSFSMRYKNIIANYSFMYIPLDLYRIIQSRFPGGRSGIRELKFIPCMTYQGIQMRSLQDVSQNRNIFRLTTYMYQWFDLMDPNFGKFYERWDSGIEFIYMKDENNWDLVNEFASDRYEQITPSNSYFEDDYFFDYISDYWELFYEKLEDNYQKECDKNFANRINMITAKTGIENHYTKWNAWKKFYKQQESYEAYYIENMINAICFGAKKFEAGYYFTVQDIRNCIGLEKLEIPSKIVSRYKKCLDQNGYYDFTSYFSLLKKELICEADEDNSKCQLAIVEQYAIERYNPNHRNEIVPTEMISQEKILEVLHDMGIKRLEDLRDKLPILLLNGNFCEVKRKYFVELPGCLFEANKTELKRGSTYNELLKVWDKKNLVVSRANIADASNIYELYRIDEEYDELLSSLKESKMFYSLLENNLSILYSNNSQVLSNIKEFWYAKFTDFEKHFISDYFHLFVSLIKVYLENRDNCPFNTEACSAGVEFDIRYLLFEGDVDICNEINQKDCFLEIYIDPSWYPNEPIQFWNEIEMNLTDEQRKRIAQKYMNEEYDSPNKIELGISLFLKHIYICDESPAVYSGYPSGKFLKIKIDDSSYDDAYLIFEDYTDAIIKLLRDEFDIVVKKSKYLPLGNLDEYNDLLPIGTQQEYEFIKAEITNNMNEYMEKINECSSMDEKQVRKELDEYKLSVLALQYQMPGNLKIRGYGKECPLLMTNDVVELRSLQCFEHPIFGFHIGITLFGSKAARDVITRYATKFQVCIENATAKKKRSRRGEQKKIFSVELGRYSFDNQSVLIRGAEMQQNKELVYQILSLLVTMLDNIQNQLIFNVEMVTDKGAKKNERFVLHLTHAHRALMVYEISSFMRKLLDE